MTDLEMVRHLLNKSKRIYDEVTNSNETVTIQVHLNNSRHQMEFNTVGEMTDEWENPYESQWISEQ